MLGRVSLTGSGAAPREVVEESSGRAFGRMVPVGNEAADVERMEALMIGVLAVWMLVALGFALVLGRAIRLADARSAAERPFTTADLPAGVGSSRR